MLAKRGYCFGAWMYWVPLGWFVKSTVSFVYCYVIRWGAGWGGGGDVTECIVCVQGHDPLTFLSCRPFSFLIGLEFYGPNYLKC